MNLQAPIHQDDSPEEEVDMSREVPAQGPNGRGSSNRPSGQVCTSTSTWSTLMLEFADMMTPGGRCTSTWPPTGHPVGVHWVGRMYMNIYIAGCKCSSTGQTVLVSASSIASAAAAAAYHQPNGYEVRHSQKYSHPYVVRTCEDGNSFILEGNRSSHIMIVCRSH